MVKRTWPFNEACQHRGCQFVAHGCARLAARTGLARHARENHSAEAQAAKHRRQRQQARRLQLSRDHQPLLSQGDAGKHLFVVTSPLRRQALFEGTRDALIAAGVPPKRIVRRGGIDFKQYLQNRGRLPAGLRRSTFLMWDFHKQFLPKCKSLFAGQPGLKFVWWVEDDCKLKKGVDIQTLHAHALAGPACIHWAAYFKKNGQARWGSHLAAVSRAGLPHVESQMNKEAKQSSWSYLLGLDSWLHRGLNLERASMPLVGAWQSSVASQRRHGLKGRR